VQLNIGAFDPAQLTGTAYERTKFPRGEFELTIDERLGPNAKLHLYGNGGIQAHYKSNQSDDLTQIAKGYGLGGRVQVGPVQVGAGGHRGTGISATYMGIPGDSTNNDASELRSSNGVFGIAMVTIGKVDVSAGAGQSKLGVLPRDVESNPDAPINPST